MTTEMGKPWVFQWATFFDDREILDNDLWLFRQWIYPNTLEMFRGKSVLDCGCGRGQHLTALQDYIDNGTGIDLDTSALARKYADSDKLTFLPGDISKTEMTGKYDIVYAIGVLHHTDDPTISFRNIKKFLKPGGRLIVWVYSHEGNLLNRLLLKPFNRTIGNRMRRDHLLAMAWLITGLLHLPVYTVYLLPLPWLPFYEYFTIFRALTFRKKFQNIFDKLNAPQTHFINSATIREWFDHNEFESIHISRYAGVSWRASGTLRSQ
jgi:SAM-dependent methyltransferase